MLAFLIAGELVATGIASLLGLDLGDQQEPWWELGYSLFFGFGLVALLLLAWVRFFERRPLATIGFNGDGAKRFVRGYLGGLALLAIVIGGIGIIGGYRIEAGGALQAADPAVALGAIGILLAGFIVQGSTEELITRGWMMQLVASRHGLWAGIVFNCVIFAVLHGANIAPSAELALGLVNVALVGLFLSLYAARAGSLWGVCGWHAAWNWLLGLGFGLEVSGNRIQTPPLIVDLAPNQAVPWWITGGAFGPEASILSTVVLAVGAVWLLMRRQAAGYGGPPGQA
ncbi:hypothetical protein FHR20_004060 [Sphingomonas leidyi]|uniref:CAAX prenyl protease 2/Lysostaphin resistance protein A-like domain-containing protein n=1 Tax=Sphingomonas leidyi TaxID=68569 RepID=A0A7X5V4H3_9SPHN|nr:CPBP family intramembrane glutamic endopeptidase [Sphingomonas leidyi]NIJ67082.1 hypothetical protein [Sphingomonas leidyi]